jgi:hypothetical protein
LTRFFVTWLYPNGTKYDYTITYIDVKTPVAEFGEKVAAELENWFDYKTEIEYVGPATRDDLEGHDIKVRVFEMLPGSNLGVAPSGP